MKLSIIIVNYNGEKFLDGCLASIREYVQDTHEIILVDNDSSDGSVEHIKKNHSDVILIESKVNLGFSRGNNLGVSHAVGEYVLLLNNDTILLSSLALALSLLEQDHDIGLIGIKMLGSNNEYRFSSGHFPSVIRLLKFSSLYKKDGAFYNGDFPDNKKKYYEVDWVEGSFMLTRHKLWEDVGGMNEDYFMYVEDIDLCRTIKDLGFKVVLYPYVSYLHYGGYGESRINMLVAGFLKFHKRHSSYQYRVLVQVVLLVGMIARVVVNTLSGLLGKADRFKKSKACMVAIKEIIK
ncbi:MAG: glycosyltransferase family 2 protein [Bacteroidales bacterium]|jgi:GT2 family glycosyltransferase|nr:glycosyltransferase family 2 protein [Bacteroidales bacterium]